jgi:hypothetical protein
MMSPADGFRRWIPFLSWITIKSEISGTYLGDVRTKTRFTIGNGEKLSSLVLMGGIGDN